MTKIAITLLLLLLGWSLLIPIFEGPDESGHYCHAEYIARNRRLPNFNVRDGCFLAYPPAYYALVAPIIAFRPAAKFDDDQIQTNPAYISNRKGKDVFSKYIHPRPELVFKWNPLLQTAHLVRLLSVAMGLGIILLTIKSAKLLPKFSWLPYASVLLFFNPMFLHTFSLVTNVTLASFLAAVFIYLHLKQEKDGFSSRLALAQGIFLGLGVLTKINMLSLVLGYLTVLATAGWERSKKIRNLIFAGTGFLLSAGWYIWRTFRLYGEPFEINIASSLRGASMTRMQDMGLINYWSSFPDTLFRTFWSGYGLNKVWLPDIIVVGLLILTLLTLLGFFSFYRRLPRLLKVSWYYVVAVLLGHAVINIKTEAFNAKDIFTAYLPLTLILSFGARNFIAEARKNGFLTRKRLLIIFGLSVIFYAKFEIVRLIKTTFQLTELLSNSFTSEQVDAVSVLLRLLLKAIAILIIIFSLKFIIKTINLNLKTYKITIALLALFNLLILFYSSFKLYFAFL
ncbi:hypothetical protein HYU89_03250 [Candidatus Collierbacteria bacterium]|nr:hypothetical protein [Candidatus Collierbacteria bacterium]